MRPGRDFQRENCQRVAPYGSAVATPTTVSKVKRKTCQGAGPALGALNGAVNASPSTSAGHPPSRATAATISSVAGSVTRSAVPSSTTSIPVRAVLIVQAGLALRLCDLRVPGPDVK